MKCKKCGKDNPPNSKYCLNCGSKIENIPQNQNNNSKTLITVGIVIIILLIAILTAVIFSMSNVQNEADSNNQSNANPTLINNNDGADNNVNNNAANQGSWHKVGTYNGVSSDSLNVATKGTQFRIVTTAMPIKNYATNYIYTTVKNNGNTIGSSQSDWGSRSAVATKTKTLEFTGSGSVTIDINAYELQWWSVEVWDYY